MQLLLHYDVLFCRIFFYFSLVFDSKCYKAELPELSSLNLRKIAMTETSDHLHWEYTKTSIQKQRYTIQLISIKIKLPLCISVFPKLTCICWNQPFSGSVTLRVFDIQMREIDKTFSVCIAVYVWNWMLIFVYIITIMDEICTCKQFLILEDILPIRYNHFGNHCPTLSLCPPPPR